MMVPSKTIHSWNPTPVAADKVPKTMPVPTWEKSRIPWKISLAPEVKEVPQSVRRITNASSSCNPTPQYTVRQRTSLRRVEIAQQSATRTSRPSRLRARSSQWAPPPPSSDEEK